MRRWLAALMLLLIWTGSALAQGAPLTLPAFADRLERAAQALSAGQYDEAAFQFPAYVVTVAAPDGDLVVDLGWLRRAAERRLAPGRERDALVAQLFHMAEEVRAVHESGAAGLEARLEQAARDRELLTQILYGAGYREAEAPTWWSRLWQRVGDWWDRSLAHPWREFWSGLDLPGMPQGSGARIFGTLAVLAVIGLLLWLGRDFLTLERLRSVFRRKAAPEAEPGATAPDELRRRALALAEAGDRREAIKVLMQSALGALSLRRLIDWQPMLTNRRYLLQLRRRRPDLAPDFDELNALFERKVYGEQPASSEEFQRALTLTDQLGEEGSVSSAS